MLSCKQASFLLSQSLERKLSWFERFKLWVHLRLCEACRRFKRQLTQLTEAVAEWKRRAENDESIQLSNEARRRIQQAIQAKQ